MALQIYDPDSGTTRDATVDDFATVRPLTPLGSVITLTVTTTSQTLAALVGGAIGAINKAVGQFQRGDSIAIEGTGALIRIYVNGLIIWEEPCITSATGTKCGLQANAGANTYFKNFTILSSAQ